MTNQEVRLDLRTKLAFLLVAPIFIFITIPIRVEIFLVLLYISLFLFSRDYKWVVTFLVIYGLQLFILSQIGSANLHPFLLFILSFVSIGMRQMMLSIISGAFLLKTTPISEWTALLTKLKAPKGVKIGVAVLARFIITVIHDFRRIRQAVAIRGIQFTFKSVISHPVDAFEYFIIPLLMNTSFTTRDLTVAALSKGLNSPNQQTAYRTYTISWVDYGYLILLACFTIGGIYFGLFNH